jgi:thiamine-phosphate pyrophosphorylase
MDRKLLARARAVKSRHRHSRPGVPPVWLFTDSARLPDPLPAIAALPRGGAGVVFRQRDAVLATAVARLCRARRLTLLIAGDAHLARHLGAGLHLRGGRGPAAGFRLVSSSVHNARELVRARRAGAGILFISPVFPTESHPGARALGACRLSAMPRRGTKFASMIALGGINPASVRQLPPNCAGFAAIGAHL